MLTKILASVCRFCPACIFKRRLPGSAYARIMSRLEWACPFCRAYDTMTGRAEPTQD